MQYQQDTYGRITYFYVQLGSKKLPVYQPSTVMFHAAVIDDGDLAILDEDGMAKRSELLGLDGAIFLAKFCAHLGNAYE